MSEVLRHQGFFTTANALLPGQRTTREICELGQRNKIFVPGSKEFAKIFLIVFFKFVIEHTLGEV